MATLQKNIGMELDKPSSIGAGSFDPENLPEGYRIGPDGVTAIYDPDFYDVKEKPKIIQEASSDVEEIVLDPEPVRPEQPDVELERPDVELEPEQDVPIDIEVIDAQPEVSEDVIKQVKELGLVQPKPYDVNIDSTNTQKFVEQGGKKEFVKTINQVMSHFRQNPFEDDPNSGQITQWKQEAERGGLPLNQRKWHLGINLVDWLNANRSSDPAREKASLVARRYVELSKNLDNGKDLLSLEPVSNYLDTDSIGFNGESFYQNPTVGERITTELEETTQLTLRGLSINSAKNFGLLSEIVQKMGLGLTLGPAVALELFGNLGTGEDSPLTETSKALHSKFINFIGMSEEEKRIPHDAHEFWANAIDRIEANHEDLQLALDKLYMDSGLFEEFAGDPYSGNWLQRTMEDFISWTIFTTPLSKLGEEFLTAIKQVKISAKPLDTGKTFPAREFKYLEDKYRKANTKLKDGKSANPGVKMTNEQMTRYTELRNWKRQIKTSPGRTPKEQAWLHQSQRIYSGRNEPVSRLFRGYGFTTSRTINSVVMNNAAEMGAAAAYQGAVEHFGEDNWKTFMSTIVGALAGISSVRGGGVQLFTDKAIYSIEFLRFLENELSTKFLGRAEGTNKSAISLIKMFKLEKRAKLVEEEEILNLKRNRFIASATEIVDEGIKEIKDKGGEIPSDVERSKQIDTEAMRLAKEESSRLATLRKAKDKGTISEEGLEELERLEFLVKDETITRDSWKTNLNASQLNSIVSTRPKLYRQLLQTAGYLLKNMSRKEQQLLKERIKEAERQAGEVAHVLRDDPVWKELGFEDGEQFMRLYMEYFTQTSTVGVMQKQLADQLSHSGLLLRPAKNLHLFSKYHMMEIDRKRNVALLKAMIESITRPYKEQAREKLPEGYTNIIEAARKAVDTSDAESRDRFVTIRKMIGKRFPELKHMMKDQDLLEEMGKLNQAMDLTRYNAMGDPNRRRESTILANGILARGYENLAEPHKNAYNALLTLEETGNIEKIDVSELFSNIIASVLHHQQDFLFEDVVTGRVPSNRSLLSQAVMARKQKLYEMMGIEYVTTGGESRPKFNDVGALINLVNRMIEKGDSGVTQFDEINGGVIIPKSTAENGYKIERPISKVKLERILESQLSIVKKSREESWKISETETAVFKLFADWVDDIAHVNSSMIPAEIHPRLLAGMLSHTGSLQHQYNGTVIGYRFGHVKEVMEQVLDKEIDRLSTKLKGMEVSDDVKLQNQLDYLKGLKEARKLYGDFKKKVGKGFYAHGLQKHGEGKLPVYSYKMRDFIDENTGKPLEISGISPENPFLYYLEGDPFIKAAEFKKFLEGKIAEEDVLETLHDTIGMHLRSGKKLPENWGEQFGPIFDEAGYEIMDTIEGASYLDNYAGVASIIEKQDPMARELSNIDKTFEANELKQVYEDMKNTTNNFYKTLDTIEKITRDNNVRTAIAQMRKLLDSNLNREEKLDILFGKDPMLYQGRKHPIILGEAEHHTITDMTELAYGRDTKAKTDQMAIDTQSEEFNDLIKEALEGPGKNERIFTTIIKEIKKLPEEQKKSGMNAVRELFGTKIATEVWKVDGSTKTSIPTRYAKTGKGLSETVDFHKMERILAEYHDVMKELYDPGDLRALESAFGLLYVVGTKAEHIIDNLQVASRFKMESVMARAFSYFRGVVSAKWLLTEATVRQLRAGSMDQLRHFFTNPDSVEAMLKVMESERWTKTQHEKLMKIFNPLRRAIPAAAFKEVRAEDYQSVHDQHLELIREWKRAKGLRITAEDYPRIALFPPQNRAENLQRFEAALENETDINIDPDRLPPHYRQIFNQTKQLYDSAKILHKNKDKEKFGTGDERGATTVRRVEREDKKRAEELTNKAIMERNKLIQQQQIMQQQMFNLNLNP